ncbi:MAG: hypothetical protein BWY80_00720 [Firmicutes bacterium ADurb.Bin456]|nr:MAG: hypothetical protein BWY80_00720 [Firmicutes bacterium ADurb.Bin456]
MPAYNGMGPQGAGPMSGWGRGYCMTYLDQGAAFTPGYGRGVWRGAGFCRPGGRGWRNCFHATGLPRWSRWLPGAVPFDPATSVPGAGTGFELAELKEQVAQLENALDYARKRIAELEKKE